MYQPARATVMLIVAALCIAAAASHTSARLPVQEKTAEDHATLYFYNTSGWKAFPEKLTVLDGGKKIAAINREEYVVLSIAPGHHLLTPKNENPPRGVAKHQVDLELKAGETYYMSGGFTPKYHNFTWTFEQISKQDADVLAAHMKLQADAGGK